MSLSNSEKNIFIMLAFVVFTCGMVVLILHEVNAYYSEKDQEAYSTVTTHGQRPLKQFDANTVVHPAADDLAGWKKYENNEYGFEFQYPEDWKLSEGMEKGVYGISVGKELSFANTEDLKINFGISSKIHISTIDKTMVNHKNDAAQGLNFSVAGLQALVKNYDHTGESMVLNQQTITFISGTEMFQILNVISLPGTAYISDSDSAHLLNEYNSDLKKIVLSFKFTK